MTFQNEGVIHDMDFFQIRVEESSGQNITLCMLTSTFLSNLTSNLLYHCLLSYKHSFVDRVYVLERLYSVYKPRTRENQ
jgi:hypothetical protein